MNVMFDFETLATTPRAVVLSLGVVLFDDKKIVAKKYFKFDVQAQIKDGREVSANTLLWWENQSPEARQVLEELSDDLQLVDFCRELEAWFHENGVKAGSLAPWGNGAAFDIPIADSLFLDCGLDIPWKFWNVQCYRTFSKLTKCKDLATRTGTHHNALDDAIYQTECVLAFWNKQRNG